MTSQDRVQHAEILAAFLTRSMLPSLHILTEHRTNYYVILHLAYLSVPVVTNANVLLTQTTCVVRESKTIKRGK